MKRTGRFVVLFILSLIMSTSLVFASSYKANISPSEALNRIAEGNNQFVKKHHYDYFKPYQTSQHPFVTMITCSDARVHSNVLLDDPIDKIFVIRNIGNQLVVSRGSIDYGILHLHTPILLILGHTHCGAVKAAMGDYSKETEGIRKELDHLHIPLSKDDKKGNLETRWLRNVERNVDWQVIQAMSFYPELVNQGKLVVVGAVYDFINAYGKGYGRMVIININGEKNPEKLKTHPIVKKLSKELKDLIIVTNH
ncbi:carbonic anhydrase [Thermodesulfatator indicus DSM 15286]|uniref:carbonic anhydrase n=1 Tax=Thermodesulfatator indicus (strain DSM 15286 / JCM 11887 / CIR29812) TaxID=667014 RepID=F8AAD2_THEID|nr:carbonic anhydrase [Thermodesulfatator indicus]AEH44271.1 carbonic anhydrase [Thermodesulfatator indicus DSM 15286]